MSAEVRLLGLTVVTEEMDQRSRRNVPVEPHVVLNVTVGKSDTVRPIRLDHPTLARLLAEAAAANARLLALGESA